jgi:anti-anti-sigma regulatory factor
MVQVVATKSSPGVVGGTEVHWLDEAKNAAEQSTDHEIVVDISAVDRIVSAELNQLIRLHLHLKEEGRLLVLQHAQHHLWSIFTMTRLNRLIEIRDPLSE